MTLSFLALLFWLTPAAGAAAADPDADAAAATCGVARTGEGRDPLAGAAPADRWAAAVLLSERAPGGPAGPGAGPGARVLRPPEVVPTVDWRAVLGSGGEGC